MSVFGDWMSFIQKFTIEEGGQFEQQMDSDPETTCTHDHKDGNYKGG